MAETTAMLFALSSPHPSLSLEDFNSWYDTRHAPSRAVCPGVHSVSRYQICDDAPHSFTEPLSKEGSTSRHSDPWTWLAVYELENESALKTAEYKKAREEDGDDESRMFDFLSRRVYKLLSDNKRDEYSDLAGTSSGKGRYLLMRSTQPPSASNSDDGRSDKSRQEQMKMLSQSPGWLRTSQWELTDARDPRNWDQEQSGVPKSLTLHEFEDTEAVFASSEFKAAWKDREINRSEAMPEEKKLLRLWKQF